MSISSVRKRVTAAGLGVNPKKIYGNSRVKPAAQGTGTVQDIFDPYIDKLAAGALAFLNELKASGIDPDVLFKGAREAGFKARERGEI